mmetsp:Transcript_20916/g.35271  ORF Transcript_20916/g.35271 Transcript_20916/m.35271 type:complete len:217 (+) Transcript_20916:230-880(+)
MSTDSNLVAASTDYNSWDPSAIFGGEENNVVAGQNDAAARKARDKAEEMLRIAQADAESEIQALRLQMEQDEEEARRVQSQMVADDTMTNSHIHDGEKFTHDVSFQENVREKANDKEGARLAQLRLAEEKKALDEIARERELHEQGKSKAEAEAAALQAAEQARLEAEEKQLQAVKKQVDETARENARLLAEARAVEEAEEQARLAAEEQARIVAE